MAEILGIFALTALLGNYINSKEMGGQSDLVPMRKEIPKELLPSSNNRVNEVQETMQAMADDLVKQSANPGVTGILPPLFNTYGTRGQKIQFEERVTAQKMAEINQFNKLANVMGGTKQVIPPTPQVLKSGLGEFENDEDSSKVFSLLTGKPLEKSHSNMTPFFGSIVKQRVEEFANVPLIERYTGTEPRIDRNQGPRFETHRENIYGSPAFTTQVDMSRFIASPYRENELPFEQTRINAPKAWGPEDNIKPQYKSIDELVVNAKETYEGRPVESYKLSGGRGDSRGIFAKINKNKPETSFEWGEDRLFKTTGAILGDKIQPDLSSILKDQKTIGTEYFGNSSAGTDKAKMTTRIISSNSAREDMVVTQASDVKKKFLETKEDSFLRNGGFSSQIDQRRVDTYFATDTQRANENTQILGASREDAGHKQYAFDLPRATTKETTLRETDLAPTSAFYTKPTDTNGNLPLKTTHKEMNVVNKYPGQAKLGSGLGYISAIDSTDLKTTNKEMGLFEQKGMGAVLAGITSEMSRDQYSEANFAKELPIDSRISGPQNFQISGSKNLLNIYVKDRELENKREFAVDFVNKEITSQEHIGSFNTKKEEADQLTRTFSVASDLHQQLRSNEFSLAK
jgi:hypothetical protein